MQRLFAIILIFILQFQVISGSVFAGDATSFNPVPITVGAKGAGGVPVGTIIAWPVARNPSDMENWLECNGQSISASVYPELFAVIGGRVPDFRGLFLRGVGGNSAALGIQQDDAFKTHFHQTPHFAQRNSGAGDGSDYFAGWGGYMTTNTTISADSSETRPKNKAVRYFIRTKL